MCLRIGAGELLSLWKFCGARFEVCFGRLSVANPLAVNQRSYLLDLGIHEDPPASIGGAPGGAHRLRHHMRKTPISPQIRPRSVEVAHSWP